MAVCKAILTKPWLSPRFRLYPPGTVFILDRRLDKLNSAIYNFLVPGKAHGFVILSNDVFKSLSEEERHIRDLREKKKQEHIKSHEKLYIRGEKM